MAHVVVATSPTMRATSKSIQPQPASSTSVPVTVAVKTMWSPGNTDVFMRKVMRPSRPVGPVQSVT